MAFPAYTPAPGLPAQAPIDLGPLQKVLSAAPNTKGLNRTAAAQAASIVNGQIAGYHAAQQGELAQAAGRAQQIGTLSQDAAHFLDKLGFAERLRAALEQAGNDQAAFAQGFSGDLRHTAEQDAAKVQQSLAAIGAPGSVPNADALANTVYGLGRIPADVLTASAPLVYAQAQTLPASLLAAGREQAVGALGAGQQAAAQYRPQIAAAIGSLPKLTQGILSDLTSAAEKARQDAIGNMFKAVQLQQDGRTEEATQAWRNAQLQGEQWKTYTAAYNHWADAQNTAAYRDQTAQGRADALAEERAYHKALAAGRTATLQETQAHNAALEAAARYTARTGRINATKPTPPKISEAGGGVYRVNPNGTITWLKKPSKTGGTSGLSANKRQELQAQAKTGAFLAANGGETHTKTPDTAQVLVADPGDGSAWSQPLYLPDNETIYGYVNHLPAISMAEALQEAAGNPFAAKQIRLAYAAAAKANKLARGAATAIGGMFGPAPGPAVPRRGTQAVPAVPIPGLPPPVVSLPPAKVSLPPPSVRYGS